jgi:protein TonB
VFKFFFVSILIHVSFLAFFIYQREVIIEDPILSVEIESIDPSTPPLPKSQKILLPKKASINTSLAGKPSSPEALTTEQSQSSQDLAGSTVPLESQVVTKKPRVLHQEKVDYPLEAETARIEGAVKLSVVVNSQGQVVEVKVLEGPGYGLNEAAAHALKKFRFSAAEKDGEKVSVRLNYIYRFRLDSR